MNTCRQTVLSDQQLVESFDSIVSMLSKEWKHSDDQQILAQLTEMKTLLKISDVNASKLEKQLEQCHCLQQKRICITTAMVLECVLLLEELAFHSEKSCHNCDSECTSMSLYSLKQKELLGKIVEFIVCNGLIVNLEFQLSLLVPPESHPCKLSQKDFFATCKHLFACGTENTLRNILVSKHLLPLLASFIQLGYSPTYSNAMSAGDVKLARKLLSNIIVHWSKLQDVVKCFIIMQGSSSRSNPNVCFDQMEFLQFFHHFFQLFQKIRVNGKKWRFVQKFYQLLRIFHLIKNILQMFAHKLPSYFALLMNLKIILRNCSFKY